MNLEKGLQLHEYGAHAPRPPGGGGRIGPNPVFLNNVRSVTGINAKLGVPLDTLILRPFTEFWTIFSKSFSYTVLTLARLPYFATFPVQGGGGATPLAFRN